MLTPANPIVQPPISGVVVVRIDMQIEPTMHCQITYAAVDANGNPIAPYNNVNLTAAGFTAFQAATGGLKAKFYAALQADVPSLQGTVS